MWFRRWKSTFIQLFGIFVWLINGFGSAKTEYILNLLFFVHETNCMCSNHFTRITHQYQFLVSFLFIHNFPLTFTILNSNCVCVSIYFNTTTTKNGRKSLQLKCDYQGIAWVWFLYFGDGLTNFMIRGSHFILKIINVDVCATQFSRIWKSIRMLKDLCHCPHLTFTSRPFVRAVISTVYRAIQIFRHDALQQQTPHKHQQRVVQRPSPEHYGMRVNSAQTRIQSKQHFD